MAQNRAMQMKNLKLKKETMKQRKDSARRIMQDVRDPRNAPIGFFFREKPYNGTKLRREPGQKWG